MRSVTLLALLLLVSPFGGCTRGMGGSHQIVPDSAKAGEPIVLRLRLFVIGTVLGFPRVSIKGRYKLVRLHYRLVGETDWHPLEPDKHIPEPEQARKGYESEMYEFVIPPYREGTTGEIEFYFVFVLDGHPNRVDG